MTWNHRFSKAYNFFFWSRFLLLWLRWSYRTNFWFAPWSYKWKHRAILWLLELFGLISWFHSRRLIKSYFVLWTNNLQVVIRLLHYTFDLHQLIKFLLKNGNFWCCQARWEAGSHLIVVVALKLTIIIQIPWFWPSLIIPWSIFHIFEEI